MMTIKHARSGRWPAAWAAAISFGMGAGVPAAQAQVNGSSPPTIVLPAGTAKVQPAVKGKAIDSRTQQEADRPMKRILEAAALAAAAATPPATVTVKAGSSAPVVAYPSPAAAVAPRPGRPSPSAEVLLASATPEPQMAAVADPSFAPAQTASVDPPLPAMSDAGKALALPSQPPLAAPLVVALPVEPQLLRMVDVDVSESLLSRMRKRPEVLVELLIDESGSVREAQVRETSHPSLSAPVLAAVRQWVFAPLPQVTRHQLRVALAE